MSFVLKKSPITIDNNSFMSFKSRLKHKLRFAKLNYETGSRFFLIFAMDKRMTRG